MSVRDTKSAISRLRGTAGPHLSGAAERLVVAGNERRGNPAQRREAIVEASFASALVAVVIALPLLFDAPRPSAVVVIALVIAIALVSRVEFDVGAGFVAPLQLVFVPVLFVVHPAWAPFVVASGLLLARLPRLCSDASGARHWLVAIGNAWFAVGPAIVLAAGDVTAPAIEHWPLLLAALAAQFVGDTATGAAREWLALGVPPRVQLHVMGLVLLVDSLLTPIGLLAALVAQDEPLAFLLVLPLAGLLAIFARERAARIDQAIELSKAYRGTALLLGDVISDDDAYTGEHSYGVIALALQVADELGLDEDERRLVEFSALLHDVGKLGVPKEIINKAGPLDDEEWAIMKQHTVYGQQMLDRVGGSMTAVGNIVRASHERWDGNGYPDGTAGEDVPLAARIVAVADTFSAITTTRSYRRAQTPEAAIEELQRCAGTQFDPKVVDAVVAILERPGPSTADEFLELTSYGRSGGARETRRPALMSEQVKQPL
ncbi:MAG TPA: HD-GYP domain-containing protein [Solirubrobacteraceae bacterium]|nr:HD-GYP domain-containing protein [Solirubrobacteraceae bacterium]